MPVSQILKVCTVGVGTVLIWDFCVVVLWGFEQVVQGPLCFSLISPDPLFQDRFSIAFGGLVCTALGALSIVAAAVLWYRARPPARGYSVEAMAMSANDGEAAPLRRAPAAASPAGAAPPPRDLDPLDHLCDPTAVAWAMATLNAADFAREAPLVIGEKPLEQDFVQGPLLGKGTFGEVAFEPRDVLDRPYTAGGGRLPPPPPRAQKREREANRRSHTLTEPTTKALCQPPPPPPTPLLPFQCLRLTATIVLRRLRCREELSLKIFFGLDHRGTLGGGGVPANPPSPPFQIPPLPPLLIHPCLSPMIHNPNRHQARTHNKTTMLPTEQSVVGCWRQLWP